MSERKPRRRPYDRLTKEQQGIINEAVGHFLSKYPAATSTYGPTNVWDAFARWILKVEKRQRRVLVQFAISTTAFAICVKSRRLLARVGMIPP